MGTDGLFVTQKEMDILSGEAFDLEEDVHGQPRLRRRLGIEGHGGMAFWPTLGGTAEEKTNMR